MADALELSWESNWVQNNSRHRLSTDEARCIDTLSAIQRPYNWVLIGDGWGDTVTSRSKRAHLGPGEGPQPHPAVMFGGTYIVVRLGNGLATFDFDDLTRLVLAAHRNAVRVALDGDMYLATYEEDKDFTYPMPCLRVTLHARRREGDFAQRHPTIEDAIKTHTPEPANG